MTCATTRPGPLHCPTLPESIQATLDLLPRGRAWPANDGGGMLARFLVWLSALVPAVLPAAWPIGFVQTGFISAFGAVRNYLETRLCDLRLEFWCATHKETHDLWMQEYGLPDPCDPFPDLCTKVAALGGARCEYFNAIVSRIGWVIDCLNEVTACGSRTGCARAGTATAGYNRVIGLILRVHTGEDFTTRYIASGRQITPRAGRMRAGQRPACDYVLTEIPSTHPARCLVERIAPAHVSIEYVA